ncbi:UNVERIFIED_CONTAM: Vacuolar protein sorting-associated protein 9A [Sesamum angustifolium]|uniref:Vacuolar protein sorting-associated protein 9A n=1 Tax=Sesamum angustifolium TaxID=2727405 RepID=A0AAW2L6Y1_9LAMI
MDNSDVFGSSTAPLTWHDFLERMRHPSAAEFVKAIKSFIVSFFNNAPDAEKDSAAMQEFLGNMEATFRAHSLWAGSSEEELESAGEGLEKYVMTKLFTRVFASISEDVKADELLHEKMSLVQQFIRPENLDIKPTYQNETSWLLAQKELQKINMYKAPRDKIACILNCCKVISNLLLNASFASNEDHPGADEFLPVLIYVTIKANLPQLHSNLSYIQRFRRQTRLVGEAAYFFANMLSVESFIMNIDAKALSVDETEFEKNMESAQALLSGLSESSDIQHQADGSLGNVPRMEPVEPKSALRSRRHQSSATHPEAGDLTVGDVEDLLNNYKQLVFKYVCLAKGLGVTTSVPSLSNAHLEQPEIAKESGKKMEAHTNDDMQNDLNIAANDSEDVSVFGLEYTELRHQKKQPLNLQARKEMKFSKMNSQIMKINQKEGYKPELSPLGFAERNKPPTEAATQDSLQTQEKASVVLII